MPTTGAPAAHGSSAAPNPPPSRLDQGAAGVTAQPHLQRFRDSARDPVLGGEDVLDRHVVAVGPELEAVVRLDELGGDADPVVRLADAPLEQRADAQAVRHLPDREVGVPEAEGGGAGGYAESFHPRPRLPS